MLQKLHISNYAIIDEIVIDLSPGLNIITGETGAGKSILVGALSLILGERFDSTALFNKEKKCVVEASFITKKNKAIYNFLKENELDADDAVMIRREVNASGKSRAFINDTPVNLTQLKMLGILLVDLHQQFDAQELGDNDFQRQVLDALAGNASLLQQYASVFREFVDTRTEINELQLQQQHANTALDYNRFLFEELDTANFKENELEQLEPELKLISNAENIKAQLSLVCYGLNESEQPVVQQLKILSNKLTPLQEFHPAIPELNKRLLNALLEVQDIAYELERINEMVQYDPERMQLINEKLSLGYKLLKKHNVQHTSELMAIKNELQLKLTAIINISEVIREKEIRLSTLQQQCEDTAGQISANRHKAIIPFTEKVNNLLIQVGMPNAKVKIQLQKSSLNHYGSDEIEFLFNANLPAGEAGKSNRFEPLGKVASGGELSRLMLCIKSLVAQKLQLPTLIFDEIDSGISGEAARQVGSIMKSLSAAHQLISITHQPQIAARADEHYFVYKTINNGRVTTSIRSLSNEERVTAIAQMLSGEKPTAAALENAREMVNN